MPGIETNRGSFNLIYGKTKHTTMRNYYLSINIPWQSLLSTEAIQILKKIRCSFECYVFYGIFEFSTNYENVWTISSSKASQTPIRS